MSFAFDDSFGCVLINLGSIRIDDKLEGAITHVEIFKVLLYGAAILKVEIKGRFLKRVLDIVLVARTGAYLQPFNAEKLGGNWIIKNIELNNDEIYTVSFSDYLLKGFDIPFLSPENKKVVSIYMQIKNELVFDIRKAVVAYLKKQQSVNNRNKKTQDIFQS